MSAVRQEAPSATSGKGPAGLSGGDIRLIAGCAVATLLAGAARVVSLPSVVPFLVAAIALALLASLVGHSVEALGDRLGAGATGVVQSALGNLPELFVVLFALRDKLYAVATATIVGSILANVLLVLGLAFLFGGIKHGRQRFAGEAARTMSVLMALSVAAMLVPSLTASLGSSATKAALHERNLSIAVSILLLGLFVASLPASLKRAKTAQATPEGAVVADDADAKHGGGTAAASGGEDAERREATPSGEHGGHGEPAEHT